MKLAHDCLFIAVIVLVLGFPTLAQNSKTSSTKPVVEDYSFTIKASPSWSDTGLQLDPGDRIHIQGVSVACEGVLPHEKAHLLMPSAPGGALLAKFQLEEPPVLASPDADLPIIEPSHLYLAVNGWQCHGTIPVKVHVQRHNPPPGTH
jgi:hypothetical protein